MGLFGRNITRRGLFRGSAATGAAIAAVSLLDGCTHEAEETLPSDPVVVEEDSATVVTGEDGEFTYDEEGLKQVGEWRLPLGNVLHAGEGTWIPVTTAGDSAMPMVKCSAFSLETGELTEVVPEPITPNASNVVIFNARCSDSAYAWVELDTLTQSWSLYAGKFSDGVLSGSPSTLWQADSEWDPPRFTVSGNRVIWQVVPSLSGSSTAMTSHCYLWRTGSSEAKAVVESLGRFATAPSVSGNTVTLTPRVNNEAGVYYGVTAYSLDDDLTTIIDRLVMPESVRPFHAVRMGDVFALSVEASYGSGGLLGGMGTYIGTASGDFITVPLEPYANICGSKNKMVIKSRSSYYVVDTQKRSYSFLSALDRSVDYGEYPARVGETDTFVTYATIKNADTGYPAYVTVRAYQM